MRNRSIHAAFAITLGCALLGLLACTQNPDHLPGGRLGPGSEERPERSQRQRHRDAMMHDVRLARAVANGKLPPRADDIRNQNITIRTRFVDTNSLFAQRLTMNFRHRKGDARTDLGVAGVPDAPASPRTFVEDPGDEIGPGFAGNGFQLAVLTGNSAFGFEATERKNRSTTVTEQLITVLNATPGRLQVGEIGPHSRFVLVPARGGRLVPAHIIEERATGSWLEVEAEIIDPERELIRMTIRPEVSFIKNNGLLDLKTLQATVTVPNGGWLLVGGNPQQRNSLGTAFFSKNIFRQTKQFLILVQAQY